MLTQATLFYGGESPPPELTPLHAGPVSVAYTNGMLRNIAIGQQPVLHQIYAAVRDHNWGTIPAVLTDEQIDQRDDAFTVRFTATHQQDDIHFVWSGQIDGQPDGTLTFTFDGEARSTFRRNRIGFCVLHPMQIAGTPCTIEHVDGMRTAGAFPTLISPHQPFYNIRAISHEVLPGLQARVLMEGDTFEMEDQRNWTDASFKTYCTPHDLPFPVTVEAGTRIRQQITLTLSGTVPPSILETSTDRVTVSMNATPTGALPPVGLVLNDAALTATEIERLRALNPGHLRLELRLYDAGWRAALEQAIATAMAVGAPLEIALFVSDAAAAELVQLREAVAALRPHVARWLVFHRDELSTTAQWVGLARQALLDFGAPIGAGTDGFFTELNVDRPPLDIIDLVAYSLNPQVHAFDNLSLVENLAAQAVTVDTARNFAPGLPIAVGPVTLKIRWNPAATAPEPPTPAGRRPPQVDARQMSLLGAGWTLGSLRYLVGADSLTYYETVGWLGVMAPADGFPAPFPAPPGVVYPLYFVFAWVGEFAASSTFTATSSAPLTVAALALSDGERRRLLLANFTPDAQSVNLPDLHTDAELRTLDATNAEAAMRDPAAFLALPGRAISSDIHGLTLHLPPYAVACLDWA